MVSAIAHGIAALLIAKPYLPWGDVEASDEYEAAYYPSPPGIQGSDVRTLKARHRIRERFNLRQELLREKGKRDES